jgi:hypothetical protein
MLTVYDDGDVLVLDPVVDEPVVLIAGLVDAELAVDAVDEGVVCTVL